MNNEDTFIRRNATVANLFYLTGNIQNLLGQEKFT
jgi:hypothetical protein